MGNEKRSGDRYQPRAQDFEGEPDEAFEATAELQKGRIEITEKKKKGAADKPEKEKKHWWQRL
jgi:hypothetical protein